MFLFCVFISVIFFSLPVLTYSISLEVLWASYALKKFSALRSKKGNKFKERPVSTYFLGLFLMLLSNSKGKALGSNLVPRVSHLTALWGSPQRRERPWERGCKNSPSKYLKYIVRKSNKYRKSSSFLSCSFDLIGCCLSMAQL